MRGRLHVVVNARAIVGTVAKEQFVSDEHAVAVEDRLAPDIYALSAPRRRRALYGRIGHGTDRSEARCGAVKPCVKAGSGILAMAQAGCMVNSIMGRKRGERNAGGQQRDEGPAAIARAGKPFSLKTRHCNRIRLTR